MSTEIEQQTIRVFEMDDCTWCAGATLEDVIKVYVDEGGEDDFPAGYPRPLTNEEMQRLKYVADPYDKPDETITFAERLQQMIDQGSWFPCGFATTEF